MLGKRRASLILILVKAYIHHVWNIIILEYSNIAACHVLEINVAILLDARIIDSKGDLSQGANTRGGWALGMPLA